MRTSKEGFSGSAEGKNIPTTPEDRKIAIDTAFAKHLYFIARHQGDMQALRDCRDGFKRDIMSNLEITKEDLVDFINGNASGWSHDRRTAHEVWVREAD